MYKRLSYLETIGVAFYVCFIQVMRHFANQRFYCLVQPLLNVVVCCNRFIVISKNEICRPFFYYICHLGAQLILLTIEESGTRTSN
jgi:hypothetical protein